MARITGIDNNIFKKIRKGILDKGPLSSHAVLGEGWRDVSENPAPNKEGVQCEKFVICDLNKSEYMAYYFYEENRWTVNGDDTLKILRWYRVPSAFA